MQCALEQQSPTFFVPGTSCMHENVSAEAKVETAIFQNKIQKYE